MRSREISCEEGCGQLLGAGILVSEFTCERL
jgi:hypothetical protein